MNRQDSSLTGDVGGLDSAENRSFEVSHRSNDSSAPEETVWYTTERPTALGDDASGETVVTTGDTSFESDAHSPI